MIMTLACQHVHNVYIFVSPILFKKKHCSCTCWGVPIIQNVVGRVGELTIGGFINTISMKDLIQNSESAPSYFIGII